MAWVIIEMIRIGIVGCGRILAAHLRGYRLLREAGINDFRITSLCARNPADAIGYIRHDPAHPQRTPVSTMKGDPLAVAGEYLEHFQPDTKVTVTESFSELISSRDVDAVNDFTSHGLHHIIAADCSTHKKDLLTQKPIAINPLTAQTMIDQFQRHKLILGVCENWRFRPQTRHVRWAIDHGFIGTLQQLHFTNIGNWWAPRQVVAQTPWRHQKQEGGGITLDIGPHLFHWVRHLGGEVLNVAGRTSCIEPKRIMSISNESEPEAWIPCDADDTMTASFQTANSVTGSLTASWAGGGQGVSLGSGPQVIGSEGMIDGDQLSTNQTPPSNIADLYRQDCPKERQQLEFPYGITDSFALLQYDWLKAIRERARPEVDGEEGLRDLACAFAVLESDSTGQRVAAQDLRNKSAPSKI
jgi:1,5-anhydro-D-fructose reductase (1,5-anhydro-D-mannitol-forming)